jgi:hypothetical protein
MPAVSYRRVMLNPTNSFTIYRDREIKTLGLQHFIRLKIVITKSSNR